MAHLGFVLAAAVAAVVSTATAAAAPNLAGNWQHRGGGEQYVVVSTANPLVYNASCVANGCTTWTKSTVSITNETSRAALIVFTGQNGRNHTGVFNTGWDQVVW